MLVDKPPKPDDKPVAWKYGPPENDDEGKGKDHDWKGKHGRKDDDDGDGKGKDHDWKGEHGRKDDDGDGKGKDHDWKDEHGRKDDCKPPKDECKPPKDDDGKPPKYTDGEDGGGGDYHIQPVASGPHAGTGEYAGEAVASLMEDGAAGGLIGDLVGDLDLPLVGDLPILGELPLDALPLDTVSDVLPV